MRRIAITGVLAGALAVSAPSLAQARHHNHHRQRRGHHHVHLVVFGPAGAFTPHPGAGRLAGPSSAPTGSTAPSASGGETAGKVASFVNGVLTLTLNDESTVSGRIDEQTEIQCESAEPTANASDDQDGEDQGDQQDGSHDGTSDDGTSNDQSGSSQSSSSPQGDEEQSGDDGHEAEQAEEHEQEDDEAQTGTCGISSLQPGVLVREAELRIGPAGAVFTDVELIL